MNLKKDVSPELCFGLANGQVLKNVSELTDSLKNSDDWVFEHHVNKERNDFSNWIRDVYQDKKLANSLKKAKNKKAALKLLENALKKNDKIQKKQAKLEEKQRKKQQKKEASQKQEERFKKIEPPKKKIEILRLLRRFY